MLRRRFGLVFVASGLMFVAGCASGTGTTSESGKTDVEARSDTPPATPPPRAVGTYPAPPDLPKRPRVGVETFTVTTSQGRLAELDDVAADEATTLLDQWGGFRMIERAQLDQLFKEQGLAGVASGEEAQQHKIHGVDWMMIGKITNLSIKREVQNSGWEFGGIGHRSHDTTITSTCGVVLRLVDPSSGDIIASVNDDFDQVFTAESSGMNFGGLSTGAGAEVQISDDDRGKILKLALDDAILKGIPKFEKAVKEFNAAPAPTE